MSVPPISETPMSSNSIHEQTVQVKRRDPAAIEHHRVRVVVDLADIARRYGPRASAVLTRRVRLLEGAVIIEHIGETTPDFARRPHETDTATTDPIG
jgi:oligoribonuclease (3'-5' exoribonuclease)